MRPRTLIAPVLVATALATSSTPVLAAGQVTAEKLLPKPPSGYGENTPKLRSGRGFTSLCYAMGASVGENTSVASTSYSTTKGTAVVYVVVNALLLPTTTAAKKAAARWKGADSHCPKHSVKVTKGKAITGASGWFETYKPKKTDTSHALMSVYRTGRVLASVDVQWIDVRNNRGEYFDTPQSRAVRETFTRRVVAKALAQKWGDQQS